MICENRDYLERFLKIQNEIPNVRKVIMWRDADEFADNDWIVSFDDVVAQGGATSTTPTSTKRWKAIKPEDLVTLIYTSGTTGPPKGVMVTHRNVCWTLESFLRVMPLAAGAKQISYLPLAHIAERMVGHYSPLRIGSVVLLLSGRPRRSAKYLRDVRPKWFFAVPRIWEKLYQGLQNAIAASPDDQKKAAEDALAVRTAGRRTSSTTGQGRPGRPPEEGRRRASPSSTSSGSSSVSTRSTIAGTGAAPIAHGDHRVLLGARRRSSSRCTASPRTRVRRRGTARAASGSERSASRSPASR